MSGIFDDMLGPAIRQLDRVKVATADVGLPYVDVPSCPFGVGFVVSWSDARFVLASVPGGTVETLYLTCGVLRDIEHDRLAALDQCNQLTRDNPAYPVFLHDAEVGWDILVQMCVPAALVDAVPQMFRGWCEHLPYVAERARQAFAAELDVGGVPHSLRRADELSRLLVRSLA